MKRIYNVFLSLLAVMVLFSCADDSLKPIVTFDQLGKGGYPRLVNLITGEYDLQDISNSSFDYVIEFVDQRKGSLIESYEIYIALNTTDASQATLWQTFDQSNFSDNADGFKELSVNIPLTTAAAHVGIDPNTLVSGDFFLIDTRVTVGGIVFTFDNSTGAINGSAFQGFFRNNVNVTCPLPDDQFSGDYTIDYVDATDETADEGAAWETMWGTLPQTVTLNTISGSSTRRNVTMGYLPFFGPFDVTWEMDFACDVINVPTIDTGVGCVDNIIITQTNVTNFNINDDSSFEIHLTEFPVDNGCGQNPKPIRFLFSK